MERRKRLSLWYYGMLCLGVGLGGLLLLMIFSLLDMAQKGDNYLDQLEYKLQQRQASPPLLVEEAKLNHRTISANSDLEQADSAKSPILLSH
jgi:hypothetical protein